MHVNLLLITLVEKPLTMAAAGNRFLAVMEAAAAAAGGNSCQAVCGGFCSALGLRGTGS
jgi:hypothetical protein